MRFKHFVTFLALAALAACGPGNQTKAATNNAAAPAVQTPSAPPVAKNDAPPLAAPEPGTGGGLPDDRVPLSEPRGPIDPKSAEAAGQVVQHYGALVEQRRFSEAERLWGDIGTAQQATAMFKAYPEAHIEIGKPTDMEGAAGSIFITVPIVLYRKQPGGMAFHRSGNLILRRVNDVPGSSEAERRWHIERIEWNSAPQD